MKISEYCKFGCTQCRYTRVRKDSDKGYLFRTRQYNFHDPSALYDVMVDDINDANGASGLFKVLYTAVGFSIPTGMLVMAMLICYLSCDLVCLKVRLIVHIFLMALWIPFTFAFIWTVTFSWSDDAVLSNYGRPVSWVVAACASFNFTVFLSLELVIAVTLLSRSQDSDFNTYPGNYWKKSNRLAVSLNSIDLDPNCEKLKPDDL